MLTDLRANILALIVMLVLTPLYLALRTKPGLTPAQDVISCGTAKIKRR